MAVVLESERKTWKARVFLSVIYSVLTLGAVTMVYPFAVMISSSFSSAYDNERHAPVLRALYDPSDRFMRSIASYFKTFPRDLYPNAPESWTTWSSVAADKEGVRHFYENEMMAAKMSSHVWDRHGLIKDALAPLERLDDSELTCNYDARDVARFLKRKYGTVEALNAAWPVPHKSFFDVSFAAESRGRGEGAKAADYREFMRSYLDAAKERGDLVCRTMPKDLDAYSLRIRLCLARQFIEHGWRDFALNAVANYRLVGDYLFLRGRAFANTIFLVVLSILASLTVNPLAAYALSRFRLACTEKILLFLLATMAFPAAVTAIPGFLLIRDLGLLNSFAALVLPTVASGMSIFILKGFFDALPRELYEAASIDGAGEWTVFMKITLPMTTPILAVNALNSFIHAYSSWEWAFLVCQKESHWTLAVWMYQMSQTFAHQPWCVMAGFVVVSIPTAAVFLLCQKVILRGIVLPSMK